jgi:hypothetical protein
VASLAAQQKEPKEQKNDEEEEQSIEFHLPEIFLSRSCTYSRVPMDGYNTLLYFIYKAHRRETNRQGVAPPARKP